MEETVKLLTEIITAILPLIGVIVGGFITYKTQTTVDKRKELKKEKIEKLKAYNEVIRLDGKSPLIHYNHHTGQGDLNWQLYSKGVRNVLYENLHLFNNEIIKSVFEMDSKAEEINIMGASNYDGQFLYNKYNEIITFIKDDYQKLLKK